MADELNFQIPQQGFDSYLYGIIPDDQAVLAGAFSTAVQQIRNIKNIDFKTFAQVVYSLETNNNLPLTNGTNVPTNTSLTNAALQRVAIGSGVYGTYTHSDFIGSMTALPYPLQNIYNGIKELQTETLINIYKQIWELCTYSRAIINITFSRFDQFEQPLAPDEFRVTGASVLYPGGGYDPNNPPQLRQEITPPLTAQIGTLTVGNNPNDPATYKRITSVTLLPAYQDAIITGALMPRVVPDPPPDAYGNINDGTAWIARRARINELIIEADAEIQNILSSSDNNFQKAKILNANWNILGTALKIEQRARYTAIAPVPIPRDPFLAQYPNALYNFVDSIPDLAANTQPHGSAQSLEMISDLCTTGGQSLIGMMREARNKERLSIIGIEQDNNIPNNMPEEMQALLTTNGVVAGAVDGISDPNGNEFTLPAWPVTAECDGTIIEPEPIGFFNPNNLNLVEVPTFTQGNISVIINNPEINLGPYDNGLGPPNLNGDGQPEEEISIITINPIVPDELIGTTVGVPDENSDTALDPNNPEVLINLNPFIPVIPPNLNTGYTASTLLPSTYDVPDAIDKVIECNCDCWIQ